eukprot:TRINITY_DN4989_c3_g1_i1.p1 TRINITY_DN4989_c3_g1~~TRINITY_DN4989_c3_g1_i1.p1  ORF type:complete len:254 (-),score=87.07 TRINITY_DN4989_c3_g1_i1:10-771(-)
MKNFDMDNNDPVVSFQDFLNQYNSLSIYDDDLDYYNQMNSSKIGKKRKFREFSQNDDLFHQSNKRFKPKPKNEPIILNEYTPSKVESIKIFIKNNYSSIKDIFENYFKESKVNDKAIVCYKPKDQFVEEVLHRYFLYMKQQQQQQQQQSEERDDIEIDDYYEEEEEESLPKIIELEDSEEEDTSMIDEVEISDFEYNNNNNNNNNNYNNNNYNMEGMNDDFENNNNMNFNFIKNNNNNRNNSNPFYNNLYHNM